MILESRSNQPKAISVFTLVMINVIAVDSLRTLAIGAEYGLALVFFYVLAALLFFIPSVLVTAELATGWPTTGGVYVWVKEAFGPKWGFFTIWLQWIYNVVWFPTIFAFIVATLLQVLNPHVLEHKALVLSAILALFWIATLVNCLGIKASSLVSILGAIFGTIIPMLFIIGLGAGWLIMAKPTAIHFSWHDFFPKFNEFNNLAFLTTILFGLMGMEMSAVHASDVKHPAQDYPKALLISSMIILSTLICASLAVSIVIPADKLSLISGLMEAYSIFFTSYQLKWCIPVIAILIVVGSLSGAAAWILGPTRGLLVASQEGHLPRCFGITNRHHMPIGILLLQGVIFSVLSCLILFLPSINSFYWILSDLTAQLALLFYIMMFAAAIRLRYVKPHTQRAFTIPGGNLSIWLTSGIAILTCLGAIVLGYFPPANLPFGNSLSYPLFLTGGLALFCLIPFAIYQPPRSR